MVGYFSVLAILKSLVSSAYIENAKTVNKGKYLSTTKNEELLEIKVKYVFLIQFITFILI